MKAYIRKIIKSAVVTLGWLICKILFPELDYGSLLILLVIVNSPRLASRITSIELPWGVTINLTSNDSPPVKNQEINDNKLSGELGK